MGRAGSELLARDYTQRSANDDSESDYLVDMPGAGVRGKRGHSGRATRLLARLRFAARRAGGSAAAYSVFNAVYHSARRGAHVLRALPTVAIALKYAAVSAMMRSGSGTHAVVDAVANGIRDALAAEWQDRCAGWHAHVESRLSR